MTNKLTERKEKAEAQAAAAQCLADKIGIVERDIGHASADNWQMKQSLLPKQDGYVVRVKVTILLDETNDVRLAENLLNHGFTPESVDSPKFTLKFENKFRTQR